MIRNTAYKRFEASVGDNKVPSSFLFPFRRCHHLTDLARITDLAFLRVCEVSGDGLDFGDVFVLDHPSLALTIDEAAPVMHRLLPAHEVPAPTTLPRRRARTTASAFRAPNAKQYRRHKQTSHRGPHEAEIVPSQRRALALREEIVPAHDVCGCHECCGEGLEE